MTTGVKKTKKVSTKPSVIARRKSALQRLEKQLKEGKKNVFTKQGVVSYVNPIALDEADITRINKEIDILKQRI